MRPFNTHPARRLAALLTVAGLAAALLGACGGDDAPEAASSTATPIPTATPFAVRPEPIIVAGGVNASTETVYLVEAGDTLLAIAARFGSTVDAILEANDLSDASLLAIGQQLRIPGSDAGGAVQDGTAPVPAADDAASADGAAGTDGVGTGNAAAADGDVYIVEPGDTAFDIALRFDVSLQELAAANGLSEDELANLHAGDELFLPRPR